MRLARTFLAIGIAVIFAIFFSYGLHVVYETPDYNYEQSDCNEKYNCNEQLDLCRDEVDSADCFDDVRASTAYKVCQELRDKCNEEFQKQTSRYKYARNSFYILTLIGIAAIVVGMFIIKTEGIGSGIIGGGILTILWSLFYTYSYWTNFNKYIKLGVLGIVLVILIFFGYKKIEKKFREEKQTRGTIQRV